MIFLIMQPVSSVVIANYTYEDKNLVIGSAPSIGYQDNNNIMGFILLNNNGNYDLQVIIYDKNNYILTNDVYGLATVNNSQVTLDIGQVENKKIDFSYLKNLGG